jgi:hypothetical protein
LQTHVLGVVGAALIGLALFPGLASAHSVRVVHLAPRAGHAPSESSAVGADLTALNAYNRYLTALVGAEHASAGRDQQIITTVSTTCSDALADLSQLSSSQLKQSALTDFADEVDADLDLAYMSATRSAGNRFASTLSGISWPTSAEQRTTSRLISGERTLLGVGESNLCGDASTLDAAPLSEPSATLKFLKRYRAAAAGLHSDLTGFQSLLSKFETASEQSVVVSINSLVTGFSDQSSQQEQTDATTVLSELGVSSGNSGS